MGGRAERGPRREARAGGVRLPRGRGAVSLVPGRPEAYRAASDEALMDAYVAGDREAFSELYRRHKGAVLGYARRFLFREDVAEEVFQDAFVRLHNSRDRYRSGASFRTWLFTIVHRLCIDHSRNFGYRDIEKRRRPRTGERAALPEVRDPRTDPEHWVLRRDMADQVTDHLQALSDKQRGAILLAEVMGYSMNEVGEILGCSLSDAKVSVHRGKRKLRDFVGDSLATNPAVERP